MLSDQVQNPVALNVQLKLFYRTRDGEGASVHGTLASLSPSLTSCCSQFSQWLRVARALEMSPGSPPLKPNTGRVFSPPKLQLEILLSRSTEREDERPRERGCLNRGCCCTYYCKWKYLSQL